MTWQPKLRKGIAFILQIGELKCDGIPILEVRIRTTGLLKLNRSLIGATFPTHCDKRREYYMDRMLGQCGGALNRLLVLKALFSGQ